MSERKSEINQSYNRIKLSSVGLSNENERPDGSKPGMNGEGKREE